MKTQLWFLHALTPLHVGVGSASAGIVDLPIAREKATGWPLVPASGFKGTLKGLYDGPDAERLFGKPESGGALAFSDARLVALPVRSYAGTFAFCASALLLNRLARDCRVLDVDFPPETTAPGDDEVLLATGSKLDWQDKVILGDLDFKAQKSEATGALAQELARRVFDSPDERTLFVERFAIVPDDAFDFLCESATEIVARISLEAETKNVKPGGLWYEETVPAEAVFALFGRGDEADLAALKTFDGQTMQLGGDASIGRGLCRLKTGGAS